MSKLKISLTGAGVINNAGFFLNDPNEEKPIYLDPKTDTLWEKDEVEVNLNDSNSLTFALYVTAFTGTGFTSTITRKSDSKTIEVAGKTGQIVPNKGIVKGTKSFQ